MSSATHHIAGTLKNRRHMKLISDFRETPANVDEGDADMTTPTVVLSREGEAPR